MTDKFIESSCGLTNGVRFEELVVDSFYTDGKPKVYKVVGSYSANPYANELADKVRDRIYFDGRDGDCYWWKDSAAERVFKNFGTSREPIDGVDSLSQDSTVESITYITEDSMVIKGRKPTTDLYRYLEGSKIKCPLRFKPNTWYYMDFSDQRYEAYLYVDSNMTFNLSKNNKPTNF